jgi:hypothetical protein
MVEAFLHAPPRMLLVCLPLFALYTRFLFRKSGLVYLPHLILALHFHTFIYLFLLVKNGWVFLAGWGGPGLAGWVAFVAKAWLAVYPVLMFRRLFGNSWTLTLLKTGFLGVLYGLTLLTGFVATIIAVFLLL